MPYALRSHADAVKATTGPLADEWNQIAEKQAGVHIVSWLYSNFRYLTNSKRPVTSLEDLEGMKIRVPQNKIMLATYQAWGASPISMSWPEVFTGLQQGVIDGQDNPDIVNYTMKFQEMQKYLTEVHYQYSLQPIVMGGAHLQQALCASIPADRGLSGACCHGSGRGAVRPAD
tara:strand:+ start:1106 stop:1624 length:519 start_codon:yes stop_codon:yes gene_type:complete